jgi:hypothetical protein
MATESSIGPLLRDRCVNAHTSAPSGAMLTAMRAWRPALQRAPSDGIILIIE